MQRFWFHDGIQLARRFRVSKVAETGAPRTAIEFGDITADLLSELDTITDGFVDVRVYKSHNALENYGVTKYKLVKGKISPAKSAMN